MGAMASAMVVKHKEKEIVVIDFSGSDFEDVIKAIETAKCLIRTRPKNSVLTLTDATQARFTPAVTRVLKDFVRDNAPYVKAGAVVGLTGIVKTIYDAVIRYSGRDLPTFPDREAAMEWLVHQ